MAIFNFKIGLVQRSQGESVVAAAAWQHALNLYVEFDGRTTRCTSRSNVSISGLELPSNAPGWAVARYGGDLTQAIGRLWNDVEAREEKSRMAKSAQLARRIGAALPSELSLEQNINLTRTFLARFFDEYSLPLSWSIINAKNGPYLQALVSTRLLADEGLGLKERTINQKSVFVSFRKGWADDVNAALAAAGFAERIDHRSNVDRGLLAPDEPSMSQAAKARQRWRKEEASGAHDDYEVIE